MLLQDFWTRYVCNRAEPPLNEKPDMVLDVLRRFYGPGDTSAPAVSLVTSFVPVLEQLLVMKAENVMKDISFITAFADRMANAAMCPVSRTIPDNIKEKLDEYLLRKRPK